MTHGCGAMCALLLLCDCVCVCASARAHTHTLAGNILKAHALHCSPVLTLCRSCCSCAGSRGSCGAGGVCAPPARNGVWGRLPLHEVDAPPELSASMLLAASMAASCAASVQESVPDQLSATCAVRVLTEKSLEELQGITSAIVQHNNRCG